MQEIAKGKAEMPITGVYLHPMAEAAVQVPYLEIQGSIHL